MYRGELFHLDVYPAHRHTIAAHEHKACILSIVGGGLRELQQPKTRLFTICSIRNRSIEEAVTNFKLFLEGKPSCIRQSSSIPPLNHSTMVESRTKPVISHYHSSLLSAHSRKIVKLSTITTTQSTPHHHPPRLCNPRSSSGVHHPGKRTP